MNTDEYEAERDDFVDDPLRGHDAYCGAMARLRVANARIAELEAAVRQFIEEVDELHAPEWVSEQAKAAGKQPWVCVTCGVADGSWPCGERSSLDALKAALAPKEQTP